MKRLLALSFMLFLGIYTFAQPSLSSGPIGPYYPPPQSPSSGAPVIIDLGPPSVTTGIGCASGSSTRFNEHYRNWIVTGSIPLSFNNVNLMLQGQSGPGAQVQAFVYVNSGGPFPAGTLTQIASSAVYTSATTGDQFVDIPLTPTGVANPGDELVVMITYPGNSDPVGPAYRLGYGTSTGTLTWIVAPVCGVNSPALLTNVGFQLDLKLILTANAGATGGGGNTNGIPTVSEWGLIFLFLGFLSVGSAWMYRRKEKSIIA